MKGKKMLAKKSKILLSAFSILTFAMSMPYSTVFAENTPELDLPSVTIKGDKAYSVTIPKYLEDNKNTQKESNDNFDIYISKLNYNSDYGVVLVGLQAKKNIDTATFSLMVENGEIADSISAEATPDSNWYYKDLVESVMQQGNINEYKIVGEIKGNELENIECLKPLDLTLTSPFKPCVVYILPTFTYSI